MYLGINPDTFDHYVRQGRIERPRVIGPHRLWDALTLEIENRFHHEQPTIGGIYIVGFDSYVKIGFSSKVHIRIGQIQRGVPVILTVYSVLENKTRRDEIDLHERFADLRTFGEWFRLGGELRVWIDGGCK